MDTPPEYYAPTWQWFAMLLVGIVAALVGLAWGNLQSGQKELAEKVEKVRTENAKDFEAIRSRLLLLEQGLAR